MIFPERPPASPEVIDVSDLDRKAISTLQAGKLVTGINGTSSVWLAKGQGRFKLYQKAEAVEPPAEPVPEVEGE